MVLFFQPAAQGDVNSSKKTSASSSEKIAPEMPAKKEVNFVQKRLQKMTCNFIYHNIANMSLSCPDDFVF